MRKLMWFVIGFTAACAAGAYWFNTTEAYLLSLLFLVLLFAAVLMFKGQGRQVKLFFFGCALAFAWLGIYSSVYLSPAENYNGETVEIPITITDYSTPIDYGISAEGKITIAGKNYKIKLYSYVLEELQPGDTVTGKTELLYTRTSHWAQYFSSSGFHLVGYLDDGVSVTRPQQIPARHFPVILRQQILELIDRTFPDDTVAFARALLLGDTSLLTYEQETALSVSGIRHVVAVSGLHVSVLFTLVYSFVGYRKVLTPAIGLPVLLLFAAVAGFTPSVVRACIMQALVILAMLFDKEYDPPTALSFAVLTMLGVNPLTICSASFQMSVACMVGIFLFSARIQNYFTGKCRQKVGKTLGNIRKWIIGCVSITLSTMVIVTPLSILYFDTVSLVSILTNTATLWAVSAIFCGIIAACIMGAVWLPLGKAAGWLLSWLIRYVLMVSNTLASFPLAAVYTQSVYIVLWVILSYILLTVFLMGKKKQPAVLFGCILLSLCVAVAASWIEPRLDNYRMSVLDVGQGQCILLQTGGKHYVIDCGGDREENTADLAAQTLLSQGVTEVDGLILTHYDQDHSGGAEFFLTRIPTKKLYLPQIEDDGTAKSKLADRYVDRITWIEHMEVLSLAEGALTLIAGNTDREENESGLCILFQEENCDILITGDRDAVGEKELLQQIQLPELEVLVVGHHGSAYATSDALLAATSPEVAVISVGANNRYRHPSQKILYKLELFGCQVLRTDENGTILIRG